MKTRVWRLALFSGGHEFCRVQENSLSGVAVLAVDGRPCRFDYAVVCDDAGRTQSAHVSAWSGEQPVNLHIAQDGSEWSLNGAPLPELDGCLDVDLGFTPATNFLPIRRLRLAIGEEAEVAAAWLSFPELTMQRLQQTYRRVAANRYHYRSPNFAADLDVDDDGLVLRYGDFWFTEG